MSEYRLERLFPDPTPNQIVGYRLFLSRYDMLQRCTLSAEEQHEFGELVRRTSLRIITAWKAVQAYHSLTIQLVEESRKSPWSPSDSVQRVEPSLELHEYLDTFLTQFKSALDHLVKAGEPIFGRNKWKLSTFRDKGNKVIRALRNLSREFEPASSELAKFVSENQSWLAEAIDFRDRMNHGLKGGVDPCVLSIHSVRTSEGISTYCPLFNGNPLEEYLLQMWWNLFHLVEGFLAYLLWARAQPNVQLYFQPVARGADLIIPLKCII